MVLRYGDLFFKCSKLEVYTFIRYNVEANTLSLLFVVNLVVLKIFLIYKTRKKLENYRINRLPTFFETLSLMIKYFSN